MVDWLNANDFGDITFFGQDWGGLIGLGMAREPGSKSLNGKYRPSL